MDKGYLWEKLGGTIQAALLDDAVTEVILNPNQDLWVIRNGHHALLARHFPYQQAQAFVRALAQSQQQFLHASKPSRSTVCRIITSNR